jgi:DNA-binding MarR family transcriptional regulator
MEAQRFILRKRQPANRRNIYVYLTPRGRALKAKLVPLAEDVNAIGVEGVPAADIGTVRRALIAIIDNLARDEALAEPTATVENVARPKPRPRTR